MLIIVKETFKKYSTVKITGNGRREARRRCTSFLTCHWRGQTCTSRDYQGEVAGKEQPTEGYFRLRKFASKGCDDWFCLCCAFLFLFGRQKGRIEITAQNDCNQKLRVRTTREYKSKHHIMVMDSSINRIYLTWVRSENLKNIKGTLFGDKGYFVLKLYRTHVKINHAIHICLKA